MIYQRLSTTYNQTTAYQELPLSLISYLKEVEGIVVEKSKAIKIMGDIKVSADQQILKSQLISTFDLVIIDVKDS